MKRVIKELLVLIFVSGFTCYKIQAQTCTAPPPPSVSGVTNVACSTSSSFTLTASGGSSITNAWYTNSNGGNAISTGSVFTTPSLTSGATYYVGAATQALSSSSLSIPPHVSTFNSYTRGMWFTAPTSFVITGLRVPTDIGTGNSSIAVLKFAATPPNSFTTPTNSFSVLYYITNVPGVAVLPVYIPINNGEIIGVMGCRVVNTTSGMTGVSYGTAGAYTSSLGSNTLTLTRLGMQFDLSVTAPQDMWAESSGTLGRVEVYADIGCISSLTPVTVTVTPAPIINVFGSSGSICTGNSAILTASGVNSYTWAHNSSNSGSIVVSPTATTIYTVSGTSTPTCISISTINIAVNQSAPVLTLSASSSNICLGDTVNLSGIGANTYTWSNNIVNNTAFSPTVTGTYTLTGGNACGTSSLATTVTVVPLQISASTTSTINCAGSPATLSASGATSYTWIPGNVTITNYVVSPFNNTTYSLTGQQGVCLGTTTLALATYPLPNINTTSSPAMICFGESATLTASGSNTYTWMPGNITGSVITVSPQASTSYSVTSINSFGCTSTIAQGVVVNQFPNVIASVSDPIICSGNVTTLSVSGAATYTWDNGANTTTQTVSPVSSTVYSVSGTDNGCSSTHTVNVLVYSPTVSISGPTAVCQGSAAQLLASSANSYTWSNGSNFQGITDTPTATSIYTVGVLSTSLGITCPANASVQVMVNPKPTVTAVASKTQICRGETATVTASGANTYSWSNTTQKTPSITVTSTLITTLSFSVTGTDAQGCSNLAMIVVVVNGCNGLNENINDYADLIVYPNPSSGNFNISGKTAMEFMIINNLGQVIKTVNINTANNFSADISGLAKGIYFISAKNGDLGFTRKIIID